MSNKKERDVAPSDQADDAVEPCGNNRPDATDALSRFAVKKSGITFFPRVIAPQWSASDKPW
jgi:hypothetical protein